MAAIEDFSFESADSGASDTVPIEAGQIKKGGLMMIKGQPCKVGGPDDCSFVFVSFEDCPPLMCCPGFLCLQKGSQIHF